MGFERNYQIKILSNQIRTYSANLINLVNIGYQNKLNPWFITGFADAESSFILLVQPRSDSKTKWRVKTHFAIVLNQKDLAILEEIKSFFGVGKLYISKSKVYYRVEKFSELQVIINHFDKYPLVTAKIIDYDLFKKCFFIIKLNKHLTEKGLLEIIEIKSSLNKGLPDDLKKKFEVKNSEKLDFKFKGIPDPHWIAGFTSGDGSFNIKTTKTRLGKVQLRYAITLHIREKDVIIGFANYINALDKQIKQNNVKYVHFTERSVAIQIVNFSDIINFIIPFFDKYEIHGLKKWDFYDFKKVAQIMVRKDHLNEQGYNQILQIKKGMNLKRKSEEK